MSSMKDTLLGCVSDRSQRLPSTDRNQLPPTQSFKVTFKVPLIKTLQDGHLPTPLVEMLVYIAREGVTTTDLFRKPGSTTDQTAIKRKLTKGERVQFSTYSFYTLASVIKNFLMELPGGIFGADVEKQILRVLCLKSKVEQHEYIHNIISSLPECTQQLAVLLFGTWFRIANHAESNHMTSGALAISVAGSVFLTCASDHLKITEQAAKVMQMLIDDFGVGNMFGSNNLEFFFAITNTGLYVREMYYYNVLPITTSQSLHSERQLELLALALQNEGTKRGFTPVDDASKKSSVSSNQEASSRSQESPVSFHNSDTGDDLMLASRDTSSNQPMEDEANRSIEERQLERLQRRSDWFLTPPSVPSIEQWHTFGGSSPGVLEHQDGEQLEPDVRQEKGGRSRKDQQTPPQQGYTKCYTVEHTYCGSKNS